MAGILGVVTTRGGTHGSQNMYTRSLTGTPLIAWSLRECDKSKDLEKVILSTDSKEVARAASMYSSKVIVRPNDLAGENVSRTEIARHALEDIREKDGYEPEIIAILPAACPLRTASEIDDAVRKMHDTGCDSVISVCRVDESPYRMVTLKDGRAVPFTADAEGLTDESKLPKVYRVNNAIFVLKPRILFDDDRLYGGDVRAIVMKRRDSVEIVTRYDFMKAENILKDRKKDIFR